MKRSPVIHDINGGVCSVKKMIEKVVETNKHTMLREDAMMPETSGQRLQKSSNTDGDGTHLASLALIATCLHHAHESSLLQQHRQTCK